jgi:predicted transcriptional regulator
MAVTKQTTKAKVVRRSISLSSHLDIKVQHLARRQNWSTNRAYESLIEAGIEAKEAEKRRFFELGERLQNSTDKKEIEQLTRELARMIYGE